MSDYFCSQCGGRTSMMGHWNEREKRHTCEKRETAAARARRIMEGHVHELQKILDRCTEEDFAYFPIKERLAEARKALEEIVQ